MVNYELKPNYTCADLVEIVRLLRAPGGCPWDREQTHESIRRDLLEEAYEVVEAIDQSSPEHLREELGDLLLQVVFHAVLAEEEGQFDLDAVADGICKKLIYRHPHVFGDVTVASTGDVLRNWDELKKQEKHQGSQSDAIDAVARSLPALWRAEKVQKKAAKVGFDWPDVAGALDKVAEETSELKSAIAGDGDVGEEFGDLLFAAVNVSRFLKLDPEQSLTAATDKFAARFRQVEDAARARGQDMTEMTLGELDALWDQVKRQA